MTQALNRSRSERLLEVGWLALAFATAAIINPLGENIFSIPKAVAVRSVVWIMLSLLVSAWLLGKPALSQNPSWRSLRTAVFALIGVILAATMFAVEPELSFWGGYERSQGTLTLVCFPFLGLIVAAFLPGPKGGIRLFWALAFSLALPTVYAAIQALGADPLTIVSDARSNITSTLGRSNFLSAYTALLVPVTLSLWRVSQSTAGRITVGILLVTEAGLLAAAETRSGLLAALIGISCWVCLHHRISLKRRLSNPWLRWLGASLLACFLAAGVWVAQFGASGTARLTIWQAVQKLIVQRPLLGYGPEALEVMFPRVYPPELVYYQGRGVGTDRAHNLLLDWTVTFGLIGVFAEISVLVVVLRSGWRTLRGSRPGSSREVLVVGALAAIAGNLAGNLISFDVLPTLLGVWLLAGLIVALEPVTSEAPMPDPQSDEQEPHSALRRLGLQLPRLLNNKATKTASLLCIAAGLVCAIGWFNARPLVADVLARSASQHLNRGELEPARSLAERAAVVFPHEPALLRYAALAHLQTVMQDEGAPNIHLPAAEGLFQRAVAARPTDYLYWAALADFQATVAINFDRRYLARAEASWNEATLRAPNHGLLFFSWGRMRLQAGDLDGANTLLRKAVDLDTTDVEAWLLLADLEVDRRPGEALVMYRQAAAFAPLRAEPLAGVARAYWVLGQPEIARRTVLEALEIDEGNPVARQLLDEINRAVLAPSE